MYIWRLADNTRTAGEQLATLAQLCPRAPQAGEHPAAEVRLESPQAGQHAKGCRQSAMPDIALYWATFNNLVTTSTSTACCDPAKRSTADPTPVEHSSLLKEMAGVQTPLP